MRLSPFDDSQTPSSGRLNLWPLYWHDGDRHAAFWPFFDLDNEGFAVRPLVARDGDALDVLWPLAHADLESGDFWALTAYHIDDTSGLFPIAGWGGLDYLGPFWGIHQDGLDAPWGAYGLFPLVWLDESAGTQVFAPFWWSFEENEEKSSKTLFPLAHWSSDGPRRRVITPLGGRGWSEDGSEEFLNVLGPVYHHSESLTDDSETTALLWPLFLHERMGEKESFTSWPLWHSERSPDYEVDRALFSFLERADGEHGQRRRFWPLFSATEGRGYEGLLDSATLFGWHEDERRSTVRAGSPLLFQYESWRSTVPGNSSVYDESVPRSWETHVATLLSFGHRRVNAASVPGSDALLAVDPSRRFTRDHVGLLFDWFLHETTGASRPDWTLPETIARHERIPLLFEYESTPAWTEWDTLLWFARRRRDATEDRFHFGWGLYRSVERPAEQATYRDLFPFLTWDRAPDRSTTAFLWRLWRHERRGEKTGGYFLFIPWGESFEEIAAPPAE